MNMAFKSGDFRQPPFTQADIDAEIEGQLPTNNQGEISALAVRGVLHDINAATFQLFTNPNTWTAPQTFENVVIAGSDVATNLIVSGVTKGVRIGCSTDSAIIQGVDNTGNASYQPLTISGTPLVLLSTNSLLQIGVNDDPNQGISLKAGGLIQFPQYKSGALHADDAGNIISESISLAGQNTISSAQFGLWTFGDSITVGASATDDAHSYTGLMANDFVVTVAQPKNFAVSGTYGADANSAIFTNVVPKEGSNPIITLMIGTNDANNGSIIVPGYTTTFTQLQMASAARAALSDINTIAGNASSITKTGTWGSDTTYPPITGMSSTTNGSTASTSIIAPAGLIYLYYALFATSGGKFTVSIGGALATDTVTGNTELTSQPATAFYAASVTRAVGLARYVVTPGTHNVVVTITSAGGAGNQVSIFGFAIPPNVVNRGTTAAKIFVAGTIRQQNDLLSANTALADSTTKAAMAVLSGDGLNVHFVDVRKYVNATLDMSDVAVQNVPASGLPPVHPNDSGHNHLRQAFEDSINPAWGPPNNPTTACVQFGGLSLQALTTGIQNTAIGYESQYRVTTGGLNTAVGMSSVFGNQTGSNLTGIGAHALESCTVDNNTAVGAFSLQTNTTGSGNTGVGIYVLNRNTTGSNITGVGNYALYLNTTGVNTCAFGNLCLYQNTTGNNNCGFGYGSLYGNLTGSQNAAFGYDALNGNNADYNTGVGYACFQSNVSGTQNAAFGAYAASLATNNNITSIGYNSFSDLTTGDSNTALGTLTGGGVTTGRANTIIGAAVRGLAAGLSNSIILADGDGNIRLDYNKTTTGYWNVAGTGLIVSGNVGIGTSNPQWALDIYQSGNAEVRVVSGGVMSALELAAQGANGYGMILNDFGNLYISNGATTGSLIFRTQNIERFNIDSNGASTFTGTVGIHYTAGDISTVLVVAGPTNAVRIGTGGGVATIQGVDQTGGLSYQPLAISGNPLTLGSSAGGAFVTLNLGMQIGTPTGADKGAGTINVATGIYLNNTAYVNPDFVFEHFVTGKIEKFFNSPGASEYTGLMALSDLRKYVESTLRLPGIKNEPTDIFTRADLALRYLEEHTLYLFDHEKRIGALEARCQA
jgi:lysophospholipase L1-like esterase